jgi:hypothetical protein
MPTLQPLLLYNYAIRVLVLCIPALPYRSNPVVQRFIIILIVAFVAAACSGTTPVRDVSKGEELAFYDFTEPSSFEEGTYSDGAARLTINEGGYQISLTQGDSTFYYAQWGQRYGDVMVEVVAEQTNTEPAAIYGVMCRMRGDVGNEVADETDLILTAEEAEATPEAEATAESTPEASEQATDLSTRQNNNGDGYLFLVDGAGRFAIMRSNSRRITPLVDWTANGAIRRVTETEGASNNLRVICQGDYLALFINETFVGDATDDSYSSGQVGLVGASAGRAGLTVTFDNLGVWATQSSS